MFPHPSILMVPIPSRKSVSSFIGKLGRFAPPFNFSITLVSDDHWLSGFKTLQPNAHLLWRALNLVGYTQGLKSKHLWGTPDFRKARWQPEEATRVDGETSVSKCRQVEDDDPTPPPQLMSTTVTTNRMRVRLIVLFDYMLY